MDPEIHFQDIVVLQDNLLGPRIGSPVSSYIVQAETDRESQPRLERIPRLKALVAS